MKCCFTGMKSEQEEEVSALKVRLAEAKKDLQKAKEKNAQVLRQNTKRVLIHDTV